MAGAGVRPGHQPCHSRYTSNTYLLGVYRAESQGCVKLPVCAAAAGVVWLVRAYGPDVNLCVDHGRALQLQLMRRS